MESQNSNDKPGTYSRKSATLWALETIKEALNKNKGTDVQVLLLTSYGFIKCDIDFDTQSTILLKQTDIEGKYELDLTYITALRNTFVEKLKEETPNVKAQDNGAILYLKNVTIYTNGLSTALSNPTVTLNDFVIFADQITGFSLIPRTVG